MLGNFKKKQNIKYSLLFKASIGKTPEMFRYIRKSNVENILYFFLFSCGHM